jgi:hypothetical protein
LTVYFEKNILLWGGIGGVFPTKYDTSNIKIWSKVLLGGPVTSIVMGIIFSILICFLHFNIFLFLLLGLMPISMGIVCLLPLKPGGSYSDGERWRRLHDGGKGEAEETVLFKMLEYNQFGKNELLIQKSDFEVLLEADFPVYRYYGYYCLYRHYTARNDSDNKSKTFDILRKMEKDVPRFVVDSCKL